MNVQFTLKGIDFEWDSQKAAINSAKHRITFDLACEIFFDPLILSIKDEVADGELREHVIGMTANWQILYVIYVMRDEVIRIISARKAEYYERKNYENQ